MNNAVHLDKCPVCGSTEIYQYEFCVDYLTSSVLFPLFHCRDCGFMFTQDFPNEENIGQYYASENYTSHHEAKGLFGLAYKMVRSFMLCKKAALVKKYQQNGRLLDIGCGQGHFLRKMEAKGFEVFGVEKNEEVRKIVKEEYSIELQNSDWLTKQKDESFNAITMWHSLEHIENLNETMREANRLLAKDGVLVIALPNVKSYDQKYYKLYWAGYDVPRHLWHFSPKTFKILAKNNGFEIKKRKPMLFDVFYLSILSERNKNLNIRKKQSGLPALKGLLFGFWACLKTLKKPKKASSIIYVLKKINE